jgi:hypothetical protein
MDGTSFALQCVDAAGLVIGGSLADACLVMISMRWFITDISKVHRFIVVLTSPHQPLARQSSDTTFSWTSFRMPITRPDRSGGSSASKARIRSGLLSLEHHTQHRYRLVAVK